MIEIQITTYDAINPEIIPYWIKEIDDISDTVRKYFVSTLVIYNDEIAGSFFYEDMKKHKIDAVFSRGLFVKEEFRGNGIGIWIVNEYLKSINPAVIGRFEFEPTQEYLDTIGAYYSDEYDAYVTQEIKKI